MKNKSTSIRYKIFFILLTLSLISTILAGGTAFYSMSEITKAGIDIMLNKNKRMHQLMVHKQSELTEEIIKQTERGISMISEVFIWEHGKDNKAIYRTLEALKNNNPYIYNTYIALADGSFTSFSKDINDQLHSDYNPLVRPWYVNAIKSKSAVWSEVYKDASLSGALIITCSKAIYNTQNEVIGVIGFDLTIDAMNKDVINTETKGSNYMFLMDSSGRMIARPDIQKTNSGSKWDEIFTIPVGEDLHQLNDSEFQQALKIILTKKKGFLTWNRGQNSNKFIAYDTTASTGWILGFVNSQAHIEQAAKSLFVEHIKKISLYFSIILVCIISLAIIMGNSASKKISKPIKILSEGVNKVSGGDLSYHVNVKTGDELELLANEFNKMSTSLQQYMTDLEITTKQKQHIESELNIASRIQRDMLPMIFPPFPDNEEIDIFASMFPAKQVGGDFYDFFRINENKICFVIADVSGKGIPASLFMVISKTLIKSEAMNDISPAEVLFNVNNRLNTGNDEMMFVTVLIYKMDLRTGEVEFANAGHNPSLLMKKNGDVEYMKLNKSKILGVFPDVPYSNQQINLASGDTIYAYTDGITEAMDPDNNQFSEERLYQSLLKLQGKSVETIEKGVQKDVKDFVKDAEQSDDITMLVVRYNEQQKSIT